MLPEWSTPRVRAKKRDTPVARVMPYPVADVLLHEEQTRELTWSVYQCCYCQPLLTKFAWHSVECTLVPASLSAIH